MPREVFRMRLSFNIAGLMKEPVGSSRAYTVHELVNIDDEIREATLVEGKVDLLRAGKGVLATAHLVTSAKATCSRCLKEYTQSLTLDFEEEYYPSIDITSGLPAPVAEDPEAFYIDNNHILDLTEAVRQYSILAMPMKPLCRDDCPGLCPGCGHDLSFGPCLCKPLTDPRWAILEKAFPKSNN